MVLPLASPAYVLNTPTSGRGDGGVAVHSELARGFRFSTRVFLFLGVACASRALCEDERREYGE